MATVELTGEGTARASGGGWITLPTPPAVPNALLDAWRYGHGRVKEMQGTGTALAAGAGELTV